MKRALIFCLFLGVLYIHSTDEKFITEDSSEINLDILNNLPDMERFD
jgi:hypothetical protein